MSEIQQIYKTRAEAFKNFIQPAGYPVKKAQFYNDCADWHGQGLAQPDKTVLLADLVAYAREKFKVDSGYDRSPADEDYDRELRELKLRKERAETEAAERKGRKDDAEWMQVIDRDRQMAAFAGLIEGALNQQTTLKLSELIYLCGGDISRASEFAHGLADLFAAALTEAVRDSEQDVEFEDHQTAEIEGTDAD